MRLIDYMPAIFDALLFMEPHGKERARTNPRGGKPYKDKREKDLEDFVKTWFIGEWRRMARNWTGVPGACPILPLTGPLIIEVTAAKTRPQRLAKFHPDREIWRTVTPDADNVMKFIADAAQAAGIVKDDKEFSGMPPWSVFAPTGSKPYVRVSIFRAPGVGP